MACRCMQAARSGINEHDASKWYVYVAIEVDAALSMYMAVEWKAPVHLFLVMASIVTLTKCQPSKWKWHFKLNNPFYFSISENSIVMRIRYWGNSLGFWHSNSIFVVWSKWYINDSGSELIAKSNTTIISDVLSSWHPDVEHVLFIYSSHNKPFHANVQDQK